MSQERIMILLSLIFIVGILLYTFVPMPVRGPSIGLFGVLLTVALFKLEKRAKS